MNFSFSIGDFKKESDSEFPRCRFLVLFRWINSSKGVGQRLVHHLNRRFFSGPHGEADGPLVDEHAQTVERLRALSATPVQIVHFENKVATARRNGITDTWVEALAQFTRDRRGIRSKQRFEKLVALRYRLRRRRLARRPASGTRRA